jgi:hypothetical protein
LLPLDRRELILAVFSALNYAMNNISVSFLQKSNIAYSFIVLIKGCIDVIVLLFESFDCVNKIK